jgi:hypothetical protein
MSPTQTQHAALMLWLPKQRHQNSDCDRTTCCSCPARTNLGGMCVCVGGVQSLVQVHRLALALCEHPQTGAEPSLLQVALAPSERHTGSVGMNRQQSDSADICVDEDVLP